MLTLYSSSFSQAVCLSISSSSFSSKLSEKLPNPMGFVISSHMSIARSKGTIIRVGVGKLEHGSMEALIFHRNITKTFALQINVTRFVISFCSCSFSSSSKLLIYASSRSSSKLFACLDPVQFQFYGLFLVLGLVPSCLLVQIQLQVQFQAQLLKKIQPDGIRYFQSYVVCLK